MKQNASDIEIDTTKPADPAAGRHKPRRLRPRWNLLTLLLLMPVVATWSQYFRLRYENARLRLGIQAMEGQSRKLRIEHTDRLAVVQLPETWYDELKWDVAFPSKEAVAGGGAVYKLCLATREIKLPGPVPPATEFIVPPGRHHVELKVRRNRDGWGVSVLLDDHPVIEVQETADWNPDRGGAWGGPSLEQPYQPGDTKQPVMLFRERYRVDKAKQGFVLPDEPANGVLLWLQPLTNSERAAREIDQ